MKVYVDNNNYVITYQPMTGRESLETSQVPIIVESITDYDKQVRKEVCEEIRSRFLSACQIEKGCDTASFSLEALNRILDQI